MNEKAWIQGSHNIFRWRKCWTSFVSFWDQKLVNFYFIKKMVKWDKESLTSPASFTSIPNKTVNVSSIFDCFSIWSWKQVQLIIIHSYSPYLLVVLLYMRLKLVFQKGPQVFRSFLYLPIENYKKLMSFLSKTHFTSFNIATTQQISEATPEKQS